MSEEAAPPEAGDAPIKSGPKGVVLIAALVGTLLVGSAAGVFAVGPMIAKKSGYVVAPSAHGEGDSASAEGEGGEGEGGGGEHEKGKEGEAPVSNLQLIDNVVLNPAGSGGSRFLMLSASVELVDPKLVEEMKTRDAEVRDIVLRVLGALTVEELTEMSNREHLKQQLVDSLGTLFKKKKQIRRIYFPQFVIQ